MASRNTLDLLQFLGGEYSLKTIDGEECIYRKINNSFDIEISGAHRKRMSICVYVWDIKYGDGIAAHTVEQRIGIKSKEDLKTTLDALVQKYQGLA